MGTSFTDADFVLVLGKRREGRQVYRIRGRNGNGMRFELGYEGSGLSVRVPENFETDGPSIPGAVRWLIPYGVIEKAMKSAAVHDLLCEDPRFSRDDADAQFWAAMSAEGTPRFWRWVFFQAVIHNKSKERYNVDIPFDGEQLPLPGLGAARLGD